MKKIIIINQKKILFIKKEKKTQLCKNYEIFHDCDFENKCCFVHGIEELRDNFLIFLQEMKNGFTLKKKVFAYLELDLILFII